jgi:outer membrane lipoprotein-sorting protein
MKRFLSIVVSLTLMVSVAWGQKVSADETDPVRIMSAVQDRDEGDRSKSVMVMEVVDDKGRRRSRSITAWMKRFEEGRKQLMIFNAPADVAGTGLLSIDYDEGAREDDQWLYLPSLKKSTRISSGEKSGSFMGTDLTYSDMTTSDPKDFKYTLLKANAKVGDEACWLIEARPVEKRVQNETGYQKSKIWVSKSKLMPIQVKAWVIEGRKLKYIRFDEIRQVDGVWIAHKLSARTVRNKKVQSTTVLNFSQFDLNQDQVTDEMFTQKKLQQGL